VPLYEQIRKRAFEKEETKAHEREKTKHEREKTKLR